MFGWGKKKDLQLVVDQHPPVQLEKNETVGELVGKRRAGGNE